MSYVRMGKSGRLGRVARANKVSRLGRGGLSGKIHSTLGYATARQRALINTAFRGLGYYDSSSGAWIPDTAPTASNPYGVSNPPTPYSPTPSSPSGSGGGLTPAEANVISSAITAAGKVGTQAIIGQPSLTYNPVTGTYTATGGATLPSGLGLSSAISSYLPLILLAGGVILLFSVVGKR